MNASPALPARTIPIAVSAGCIGLIATGIAVFADPTRTWPSYLLAFFYWTGLSLGALGILLLQYVTGGEWGRVIRRFMEAASLSLILMALFAIPVLLNLSRLYIWVVHPALHVNTTFLNAPFFAARTAIYFVIWSALAWRLRRWSVLRDDELYSGKGPESISAVGLVLFVLTVTLASVDWIMSLEPDWYSTIFGVLVMMAQGLSALSAGIVVLNIALKNGEVTDDVYQDYGNLLLMFVLLWGYMAFSQYLVVWSGNMPEETAWYLHRRSGGWPWVATALIVFHFAVPFFLLLFRSVKRKAGSLCIVAGTILAVHFVDCYWLIMPTFRPGGPMPLWQDFAAMLGMGGVWIAAVAYGLKSVPLIANDSPHVPHSQAAAVGGTQ